MTCTSCKQILPDTARFCPYCGSAVAGQASAPGMQTGAGSAPAEDAGAPACEAAGQAHAESALPQPDDETAAPRAGDETALPQPGGESAAPCAGPARGMRVREYFLCLVLFCIPVLGLVPMVAWAFSPRVCEERRRLSQAALCLAAVVLAAILLALLLAVFVLKAGAAPARSMI